MAGAGTSCTPDEHREHSPRKAPAAEAIESAQHAGGTRPPQGEPVLALVAARLPGPWRAGSLPGAAGSLRCRCQPAALLRLGRPGGACARPASAAAGRGLRRALAGRGGCPAARRAANAQARRREGFDRGAGPGAAAARRGTRASGRVGRTDAAVRAGRQLAATTPKRPPIAVAASLGRYLASLPGVPQPPGPRHLATLVDACCATPATRRSAGDPGAGINKPAPPGRR